MENKSIAVSIIVPCYNAEKYLGKCVSSVLRQTFDSFELILVDDGSKDSTPLICDRFAESDKRVRVIHKQNGGVSSARNTGIENAEGKYICFIDSDDWIPKNSIKLLYSSIETNQSDLSFGGLMLITVKKSHLFRMTSEAVYDRTESPENYCNMLSEIFLGPCAKLFRADIMKKMGQWFRTDIRYAEDTEFLYRYLYFCSRVSSVSENVYYYNRLMLSSASKTYHPQFDMWLYTCFCNFRRLFENSDGEAEKKCIQKNAMRSMRLACQHYAANIADSKESVLKIKEACELFSPYIEDNRFNDYKAYIKEGDYTSLRSHILQSEDCGAEATRLKLLIKKAVIGIKTLLIIRLGLKYGD